MFAENNVGFGDARVTTGVTLHVVGRGKEQEIDSGLQNFPPTSVAREMSTTNRMGGMLSRLMTLCPVTL